MKKLFDYLYRIIEKKLIMCRIYICYVNIYYLVNVLSLRIVLNEILLFDNLL